MKTKVHRIINEVVRTCRPPLYRPNRRRLCQVKVVTVSYLVDRREKWLNLGRFKRAFQGGHRKNLGFQVRCVRRCTRETNQMLQVQGPSTNYVISKQTCRLKSSIVIFPHPNYIVFALNNKKYHNRFQQWVKEDFQR